MAALRSALWKLRIAREEIWQLEHAKEQTSSRMLVVVLEYSSGYIFLAEWIVFGPSLHGRNCSRGVLRRRSGLSSSEKLHVGNQHTEALQRIG